MGANNPDRGVNPRLFARVVAAGLLMGGVASVALAGTDGSAPASKTKPTTSASPTRATAPSATAASKSGSNVTVVRPASKPNAATAAKVKRASAPKGPAPVVQSPARLDEPLTYQYNALGRRDPFQSLLSGEYVGADIGGDAPPDVGALKVVGIVWGDADQFALVEDARGDSHILRRGDKVMNGYVEALKRNGMVVNLTVDGQSQSVTVPLTRKGENSNANR